MIFYQMKNMLFSLILISLGLIPLFLWIVPANSTNSDQFFGAFIGVISALIIFLIQKMIDQYFEKKRKNRLSIAKIQIECVKLIHAMEWNMNELNSLLVTLKEPPAGMKRELTFYLIQPREMFIDPTIAEGIKKLEFFQDFFDMYLKIRDVSAIMKSTKQMNERFEKLYRGKTVSNEEVKAYRERLITIIKTFTEQQKYIKNVLAKSRVLLKRFFLFNLFSRKSYSKKQKELFSQELKEINDSMPQYKSENV